MAQSGYEGLNKRQQAELNRLWSVSQTRGEELPTTLQARLVAARQEDPYLSGDGVAEVIGNWVKDNVT